MAFTMTGSLSLFPKFVEGSFAWSDNIAATIGFTNGTGSNQADGYWSTTLTIDAADDDTLDLAALSFSAFDGTGTIAFDSVKTLIVINESTTTALTIEPGSSNGWDELAGALSIGKAGVFVLHSPVAGLAVTGTSKTLLISNTDTVNTLTGNTTTGQKAVTGLSSTTGLVAGMLASGSGIPTGATIASITNSTSIMLSANATATATGVSIDFQWPAATVKVYAAGILD